MTSAENRAEQPGLLVEVVVGDDLVWVALALEPCLGVALGTDEVGVARDGRSRRLEPVGIGARDRRERRDVEEGLAADMVRVVRGRQAGDGLLVGRATPVREPRVRRQQEGDAAGAPRGPAHDRERDRQGIGLLLAGEADEPGVEARGSIRRHRPLVGDRPLAVRDVVAREPQPVAAVRVGERVVAGHALRGIEGRAADLPRGALDDRALAAVARRVRHTGTALLDQIPGGMQRPEAQTADRRPAAVGDHPGDRVLPQHGRGHERLGDVAVKEVRCRTAFGRRPHPQPRAVPRSADGHLALDGDDRRAVEVRGDAPRAAGLDRRGEMHPLPEAAGQHRLAEVQLVVTEHAAITRVDADASGVIDEQGEARGRRDSRGPRGARTTPTGRRRSPAAARDAAMSPS